MNQTVNQVRSLERARSRQREVKKELQKNWARVIDRTPDDFDEAECNMPRPIPHAWQHME
ncbi:hypothetical protein [Methylocaldum gracile]|uniref:hypothetical protein n=1 Tax=Methylocaldum sp. 0917 TaxID=2485163 RepID=UPI0010618F82